MNINKFAPLAFAGLALAATSCGENAWNDHLDGFKGDPAITDVKSVDYTLTDADYSGIASNKKNILLAGADKKKALEAVGTNKCFNAQIPAHEYLPAFMDSTTFPYFTLSNGSSINLTYNVEVDPSEELLGIRAAKEYIVSDADYQRIWGSENDYTQAFTPKHPVSSGVPSVLKYNFPEAVAGDYVLVNYNTSDFDPTFGGGSIPDPGTFTPTSVIADLSKGDTADINGIVTAVSTNGFILTDNSGSIFCYMKDAMDAAVYKIGAQVVCNAVIGAYNTGLQIDGASSAFEVKGEQQVKYPEPRNFTLEVLTAEAARTENQVAEYGYVDGKVKISGNNINIDLGSEDVYGGVYYATDEIKAQLADGASVRVYGYFMAVAAKRYCNFVAVSVSSLEKGKRNARSRVVKVPSTNVNAVYRFNGSSWSVASDAVMLSAADYSAMGLNGGFISDASAYIPTFLRITYPYAKAGDFRYVVYKGGATADKAATTVAQYNFDGAEWSLFSNKEAVTEHWTRVNGTWMYDPNVTVTLPAGKSQELSTLFYQACVDWVYENIDKPLGSTSITSGVGYVTKYGNNEYYSGTSAYQGNVDLRASAAKTQYAAGYEGMTDEEIVALMKKRFESEVFPAALSKIYPEAAPIEGIDAIIYTVNFYAYNGSSTTPYVIKYKVVGKGKFEFVECNW